MNNYKITMGSRTFGARVFSAPVFGAKRYGGFADGDALVIDNPFTLDSSELDSTDKLNKI